METKTGFTKGERFLYCGEERWQVLIRSKPNRPDILIGGFIKKEDAMLDLAAPEMYEALKLAVNKLENEGRAYEKTIWTCEKALAKADGKE